GDRPRFGDASSFSSATRQPGDRPRGRQVAAAQQDPWNRRRRPAGWGQAPNAADGGLLIPPAGGRELAFPWTAERAALLAAVHRIDGGEDLLVRRELVLPVGDEREADGAV